VAASTPKQLLTDLKAGRFHPVYFFYGPEAYRVSQAEKYLARQFLPDRQIATNFRHLDGRTTKCVDLLAELASFPMLGERQVWAVSSFQRYQPDEIARVLAILQPPDPNRIVIFTSPPDWDPKPRKSKKDAEFLKRMADVAEVVFFARLTLAEASAAISRKLTAASMSIDPAALQMLVGLVSGDSGALESEVNKLIDYKGSGGTVTTDDVGRLASGHEIFDAFQLADEVIAGDRSRVLAMVRRFLAEGQTATGLLYFLGRHFIEVYLFKQGRPMDPSRRWLAPKFREQAARFRADQLEKILLMIADADVELRGGRVLPGIVLDRLMLQLIAP